MALTTYTELKAAIADYINRTDLTSQIPDFITLAEAEFQRMLIVPEREEISTAALTTEELLLPTDFHSLRALYIDADPKVPLVQMTLFDLRNTHGYSATGKPQNFAIQSGDTLIVGPAGTYTLVMHYYKTIPVLSGSNASNWLLASHPDAYLFGALVQAEAFMVNDARIPVWAAMKAGAIGQIMKAGARKNFSGSPLRARSPFNEGRL